MARESAYWVEFKQEAVKKESARLIPQYDAIEVVAPILILVHWKTKCQVVREGKTIKEYWREDWGLVDYKPGEVLHREWRKASDWEIEEWKDLSGAKLEGLGVFRKNGELSVQIVEKIKDLPAAVRQRGRHIPARKIGRARKNFMIAGDAQTLADYASRLSGLLQELLKDVRPGPRTIEKTSTGLNLLFQVLKRSQTSLKRKALEEIQLAKEGKFLAASVKMGEVISIILNQRLEDYEIAVKSVILAEKWRDLMNTIERRFRDCYYRLGQLGEKTQKLLAKGENIQPKDLLPLAREAHGIYLHLVGKVPNFNPYYERLQTPEFQRLSKIVTHAEEGKAETVLNDIEEALSKLEAVALGERPTQSELQKRRKELS